MTISHPERDMNKRSSRTILFTLAAAGAAFAATAQTPQSSQHAHSYVAKLLPMNSEVSGTHASGEAHFIVNGDELTISVNVKDAQPSIVHWQHFHGFEGNRTANCPTVAADVNGDGVVDITETEAAAGTTMVPFNTDPAGMDVPHGDYPTARADGSYEYRTTVSLKALEAAFHKAFGNDQSLDLDRRVVMIHGVSESTQLPSTVASLGDIPARVTLPIACGRIEQTAPPPSGL